MSHVSYNRFIRQNNFCAKLFTINDLAEQYKNFIMP